RAALHARRIAAGSGGQRIPPVAGFESGIVAAPIVSGGDLDRTRRAVAGRSAEAGGNQTAPVARSRCPQEGERVNVCGTADRNLLFGVGAGLQCVVAGRDLRLAEVLAL